MEIKAAIMAKSKKGRRNGDHGYCVAGITEEGKWIRLVSDKGGDSLPEDVSFKVGQVIVADVESAPLAHQPENAVLGKWRTTKESSESYITGSKPASESCIFGNTANHLTEKEMIPISFRKRFPLRIAELRAKIMINCQITFSRKKYIKRND